MMLLSALDLALQQEQCLVYGYKECQATLRVDGTVGPGIRISPPVETHKERPSYFLLC